MSPIVSTFAYCLMPNHLHILVKIKTEEELQSANKYFLLAKQKPEINIKKLESEKLTAFVSSVIRKPFLDFKPCKG